MKRAILTLMMLLLPAAVIAQQNDSNTPINARDSAGPDQTQIAAASDPGNSSIAALGDTISFESAPAPEETPEQTNRQAPAPGPSHAFDHPTNEGSMVGYIDDALIGSQIRVRFEAGFDDRTPDLAEFFYAKCGCYTQLQSADPPAYDPKAPGPGPGIVTSLNFQQVYLYGEYAFNRRFSLFAEVPFRWIQAQSFNPFGTTGVPNAGGLSDIRGGFKLAAIDTSSATLTIQLQGYFPSGKASAGLGTHHNSIEPAVLYYQRFSPRFALEAQVGDWHPIGGSAGVLPAAAMNSTGGPTTEMGGFAGDIFFYGVGPSYKIYNGENVSISPVLEMVGWRVISGFETVWISGSQIADSIDGTNIVNLKFGFRTTIGRHNSIYVGYGHALTHATWYNQLARVEYRYSF
jgi:hypothetical protein